MAEPLTKHEIEKAKPKPPIKFPQLDWIPQAMRDRDQWVLWNYVRTKDTRWTKVLYYIDRDEISPNLLVLYKASSTDPRTWTAFGNLFDNYVDGCVIGLGFVLSEDDPFCAIDLDDCRNKLTGVITPEAQAIIDRFNSYTEISPSGTGVKIYFKGKKPGPKCKHTALGIEIYERGRFLAVTGDLLPGSPDDLMDRQEELNSFYAELFPEPVREPGSLSSWSDGHTPPPPLPCDLGDEEILDKAISSRYGDRFYALWCGSTMDCKGDASSADYALASSLAYWVGNDPARIQSLMMRSGLRRAKWTERKDYLPRTIQRAIQNRTTWYDGGRSHLPQPFMPQIELDDGGHQEAIDRAIAKLAPEKVAQRQQDAERIRSQVQAKLEAARAVAAARADQSQGCFHCRHCRPILMRARPESHAALSKPYVIWARCQKWTCDGCRAWLVMREHTAVRAHFRAADALYEFGCSDEQWETMRQRIQRADGEYHRIRDGEGWYVVTSAHVRGSIPVTAEMATSVVRTLLEAWEGEHRPITTSRGWCLLKEESELDLERVGMCHPSLTPNDVAQIAQAFDATVQTRAADPTRPKHVVLTLRVVRNTGWDAQAFDRFAASLYAGHVVHRCPTAYMDGDDLVIDPGRSAWSSSIAQDLGLSL